MGLSMLRHNSSSSEPTTTTSNNVKSHRKLFGTRSKTLFHNFVKRPLHDHSNAPAPSKKDVSLDFEPSPHLSSSAVNTTPKKFKRFKDQNATEILFTISSSSKPLPPDHLNILTDRLLLPNNTLTASKSNLLKLGAAAAAPATADSVLENEQLLYQMFRILVEAASSTPKRSLSRVPSSFDADGGSFNMSDARSQFNDVWIITSLVRFGTYDIRDFILRQPALLKTLFEVFVHHKAGHLPEPYVHLVVQVLQSLLFANSKVVACALQTQQLANPFLAALLRHIDLHPVVDLLPRFVGCRSFPARDGAPLLPAHKKAIALLGNFRVHAKLAAVFANTLHNVIDGDDDTSNDGLDEVSVTPAVVATSIGYKRPSTKTLQKAHRRQRTLAKHYTVLRHCCMAMAEISARASVLQFKYEDADERSDGMYASGLGIITSSMYNDCKRHLDLFFSPAPAADVWRAALQFVDEQVPAAEFASPARAHELRHILLPPLQLVARILRVWRVTDPSFRRSIVAGHYSDEMGIDNMSSALVEFWPALTKLVTALVPVPSQQEESTATLQPHVGVLRITLLDLLNECVQVLDERCVTALLCDGDGRLLHTLAAHLAAFSSADVYAQAVVKCVRTGMQRFPAVDTFVRQHAAVFNDALRPLGSEVGAHVAALLAAVNKTDADIAAEKQREQEEEEERRKKELESQSQPQPQQAKHAKLGRGRLHKTTVVDEDKKTSAASTNKETEKGKDEDQEKDQVQDQDKSSEVEEEDEWFNLGKVARQIKGGGPSLRRQKSESQLACVGEDLAQELYVMNGLKELAGQVEDDDLHSDDFVGQAVETGSTHKGKGLSLVHLGS